jgi:hypothetical protein
MWQRPSKEVIAGLGECVRLFTDSGDEDAAAMALAARATARIQYSAAGAEKAEKELHRASVKLRALGNGWAEALTEVSLGRLAWVRGRTDEAFEHFDRATTVAVAGNDLFTTSVAGNLRSRLKFLNGDVDAAEKEFVQTLMLSIRLHYDEGVAYSLEGLCAVAAARGDARRAGALSVAAAGIRHRIGVFDVEAFTVHTPHLAQLRAADPDGVAAGERAGAELTVPEAVALALPEMDRQRADPLLAHW